MALTVNQQPQTYTPTYNEMSYLVESDQTAQANFRIKVEVYIDLPLATGLVYTGYFIPRPSTTEIIFDAQRIVENYVANGIINDLVNESYGFQEHTSLDSVVARVVFTEQYGSPRADQSTTSVTLTPFNASLKYQDFIDYVYTEWIPALNTTEPKFLTYAPSNINIGSDESASIAFIVNSGIDFPVSEMEIKVYNEVTLQKTFLIDHDELNGDNGVYSVLVGTKDLEASTFTSGVKPVFNTDSTHYTIQLLDDLGDPSTELRTFTIKPSCDSPYRVFWLNRLGGIDSFTFEKKHINTVEVQRDRTNRVGYLYGTPLSNNLKAEGDITYNVTSTDKIKLVSDWLNNDESIWLEDLITSSEIWIYKNSKYHSILIDNSNTYQVKTQGQDGTFNLELDVSFAYKSNSQRA